MSDSTPSEAAGRPILPERLNQRFVLEELIGRGTCSEVYRARDLLLDRVAAVKVFPVADDPRIAREVSLLASLDHPSLVAVYDVGEVDGRAFVVMTLLEGGNLVDRLADGPLPVGDTLLAVAAVADGLGHVHRAGVLHRDVTPRNVLFDADGRAHLSDFGVALVVDAPRITDTGIVVGSAPYLAPEQVRGETVGAPADVYALGLVMIEALTARPAYPGAPLEAATARLAHRPELPPGLGADVVALLEAMTADDPADRPGADAVCVGLRRAALAAETSTSVVPVAPLAGVGIACAVPGTDATTTTTAGGTTAAAVGVPAETAAASAVTVVSPAAVAAETPAETPFEVRTRAAGAELAANARGLVVVGSVVASIVLAGGVVFASAWTVDSATSLAPPYATVPPVTADAAGGPPATAGGTGSGSGSGSSERRSSRSGSSAGSEETTDGGSARQVAAGRTDGPAAIASPEPTEAAAPSSATPSTTTPSTPVEPSTPADDPTTPRDQPSVPTVPTIPSLPSVPTIPSEPTSSSTSGATSTTTTTTTTTPPVRVLRAVDLTLGGLLGVRR